jgi:hypothetical protein
MVTSLASTRTTSASGRAANARSATTTRRSCQRSWVSRSEPSSTGAHAAAGRQGRAKGGRGSQRRRWRPTLRLLRPWGMRERLLQQWADLAMLGPMGQRLLAKILEPRRTLIMDRRTMVKLLGTGSAAAFWSCCETLAAPPRRKRNHRSCSSRRARTSSIRWRCAISTCTTRPRQPS